MMPSPLVSVKNLVPVAEEAALWDEEGRARAAADRQHLHKLALREPSFSMTAPMLSLGTSTTTRSTGSQTLPSMDLGEDARGLTANS